MFAVIRILTVLGVLTTAYAATFAPLLAEPFEAAACEVAPKLSSKAYRVPQGAIWKAETIREADTPQGYWTAVAWVNAATALPCNVTDVPATIEIRAIRFIEQDLATKKESIIQTVSFDQNRNGFQGGLFQRQPAWFGPGEGGNAERLESYQSPALLVDLGQAPQRVYHGWTNPRTDVKPNTRHIVEAEVRITGAARFQLGVDYWRDRETDYNGYDSTCQKSANCEAWIGKWYGDTNGKWKTIRSPKDFD